ncbi:MAG: peptidoglycan-binding protein [Undibacterium sp.]|nr:peptidoglycan-binding protein [Undibacterium sp.]
MTGQKALLKISACTIAKNGSISVDSSRPSFEALINPSGYGHEFSIKYAKNQSLGQAGNEAKFHASQPEKLHLEKLVLDGTGAVPGTKKSVKEQVDSLRNSVYTYVGTKHEAPIVQVVWGNLLFYGRVEGLKLDYTLFKPNGEPLRAKVTLNFVGYTSAAEIVKAESKSSPDLSHIVVVKAGDTLPLLCDKIYRDPNYYIEVARINNLNSCGQLQAGITLRFPPLA